MENLSHHDLFCCKVLDYLPLVCDRCCPSVAQQRCDEHRKCGDGDAMRDAAKPILVVCGIRILFWFFMRVVKPCVCLHHVESYVMCLRLELFTAYAFVTEHCMCGEATVCRIAACFLTSTRFLFLWVQAITLSNFVFLTELHLHL